MSAGYNEARCAILAARLGITFREACALVGAKGARRRRVKQAQAVNARIEARKPAPWWVAEGLR